MATLNKAMLIGNVGSDPDVRSLEGGNKVASFSLATTERYKDRNGQQQEKTEWHRINAWGRDAEFIENYVKKGSSLYVEGSITYREYTGTDGMKRSTTEIKAQRVQLLGGRDQQAAPEQRPQQETFTPQQQAQFAQNAARRAQYRQQAPVPPAPAAQDDGFDDMPF